jgi:TolB protein
MAWVAAAAIGAIALAAGFGVGRRGAAPPPASASAVPTSFQQLTIAAGGEGQPSIAPDGESFVYVAGNRTSPDIFLQRIGGRKAVNLTADCAKADSEPAFSPDGRQIAYRSECSGGGLFVMGATGESPRKVSDVGYAPAWSPDGHEIAYVTEQVIIPWARSTTSTLWAVDVQTGKKRKVSDHDAVQPAWSPDGKRIAFWGLTGETSSRDLFTVAADGSQSAVSAVVAVTNDADLDWSPVWEPSGRGLYFSSTRGGTFNLWRIPVDVGTGRAAGPPVPVTVPSSWAGWISISRDGKRLIYTDRNARTVVRRAALDPVTGKVGAPVAVPLGTVEVTDDVNLSPDGSLLVFSNAGVPAHLFVVHADGSGLVQLTDGPFRDRQASFSPDGREVAFQTTRFSNSLAVVHTDGSGLREVPGSGFSAWFPHWTPDGKRLIGGSRGGMFSIPVEGGTGTPLGALTDGRNFWPTSISNDGRMIIGTVFDAAGTTLGIGTIANPEGTFHLVSPVTDYVGVIFLPDGKRFIYVEGNRLLLTEVSGGTPHEIVAAAPDKFVGSVSVSQDGRSIAWLEVSDESDIWMATLPAQ